MLVAKQPLYQPSAPLRQVRPRPNKRHRARPLAKQDKAIIVAAILLMGIATLGLVWRFAAVNDLGYRLTKLERQISRLEQANAGLKVELNRLSSPSQVERRAIRELGMQWPAEQQIVNVATGPTPAGH